MKVLPTALPEVKIIEPRVIADDRGFFLETWNARTFAEAGLDFDFVQDNHSRSQRGVLRGLHYQLGQPQGKLVRVTSGRIFDVAVDLRRSSATFGQWAGVELTGANKFMLWIPPGFAHDFVALEDDTDVLYKCTALYAPNDERCLAWNDPDVGIAWPLKDGAPLLSAKDSAAKLLDQADTYP